MRIKKRLGGIARCGSLALAAIVLASSASVWAQDGERAMTYGITGSAHGSDFDNPGNLLNLPAIQAVVFAAADGPIGAVRLAAMLSGTGAEPAHLVRTGILRRLDDGRYAMALNYQSADDNRLVRGTAARYSQSFAAAFAAHRDEFDRLLARYDLDSVDDRLIAMALIGCVVLDWDGLGLTAEEGYRSGAPDRGELGIFIPWARESTPDISVRALYWGSHNSNVGETVTSTFGDHHAIPRVGFPDVLWNMSGNRLDFDASDQIRDALAGAARVGVTERRDDALALVVALRDGPGSTAQMAQRAGLSEEEAGAALGLLAALHYAAERGDGWHALVPVFDERDRPMIEEVRALGSEIMGAWLRENFAAFRQDVSAVTALRAGVPYGVIFTQHWHDIFGWTNYRLVRAGMLADPYGPDLPFTGFVPFVHAASLDLQEGTRALN